MPISHRKLLREITDAGCTVRRTANGHYEVISPAGIVIAGYATSHGSRTARGEVLDRYVRNIRKALETIENSTIDNQ